MRSATVCFKKFCDSNGIKMKNCLVGEKAKLAKNATVHMVLNEIVFLLTNGCCFRRLPTLCPHIYFILPKIRSAGTVAPCLQLSLNQ